MRYLKRYLVNFASKLPQPLRKILYRVLGLNFNNSEIRHNVFFDSPEQVNIGKNCFIGCNSIILKGTVLGDGCVVGAGAVVAGKYGDNSVIAGNPARVVKRL